MKIRLLSRDIFVLGICILILIFSSIYLYKDFTSRKAISNDLVKQGFITFKYRVAQRKLSSRMIWEDVEQMLPIYNKDSIRTDNLSEAIVTLNSGVKIELDPNSMFVLNIIDKKLNLELGKGTIQIKNSGYELDKIYVNHKGSKLEFQNGEFQISEKSKGLEVFNRKGNAKLNQNGKIQDIYENKNYQITDDSIIEDEIFNLETKPENNHRYFSESSRKEIKFEWVNRLNSSLILLVSKDREFTNPIFKKQTSKNSESIELEEGIYFWKLISSSEEKPITETKKFRIIYNPSIELIYPKNKEIVETENGLIEFNWSQKKIALDYQIEIAKDKNFKEILIEEVVHSNYIQLELPEGHYFYRVKLITAFEKANIRSKVYELEIKKTLNKPESNISQKGNIEEMIPQKKEEEIKVQSLEEVKLIFPKKNMSLDMNDKDSIQFKWTKVKGANEYKLTLQNSDTKKKILEVKVTKEMYNFTDLEKLDEANFIWTVEAFQSNDQINNSQMSSNFRITLGDKPLAPDSISKTKKEE
jgi:hypothetical protein